MSVPDKIYLNIPKQELEAPLDSTTWDTKAFDCCINVEYIRKDALLDWLNGLIKDCENSNSYVLGLTSLAYQDLVNKIESL